MSRAPFGGRPASSALSPKVAPLDVEFNVAVNQIVSRLCPVGYDVTDEQAAAPSDLAALNTHIAQTGRIIVWSGASDRTIYGCSETNWAARVWHDWCHWHLQAPFTPEGEALVAEEQKRHIGMFYPGHTKLAFWKRLIDIEVNEQVAFHAATGTFPADQHEFALDHLACTGLDVGVGT